MSVLNIGEDELHDLVQTNQLRAFRVDREMQFREDDVQLLANGGTAGGVDDVDVVNIDDADVLLVETPAGGNAPAAGMAMNANKESSMMDDKDDAALIPEDDGAGKEVPSDGETVLLPDGQFASDDDFALEEDATEMALEPAGDEGSTEPVLEPASSDGLGTEEIIFEDDDLDGIGSLEGDDVGTQEVTVQESALDDEMGFDDAPAAAAAGAGPARRRAPSRRSGAAMRRSLQQPAQSGGGDTFWAAVLVLSAIMMIYPGLLYINMAWQGFIAGNDTFTDADIRTDGVAPTYGPLFVHGFFDGFLETEIGGAKPAAWMGKPSATASSSSTSTSTSTDDEGSDETSTTDDAGDTGGTGDTSEDTGGDDTEDGAGDAGGGMEDDGAGDEDDDTDPIDPE